MADVETREQGQSDESSSSATLSPEAKAEKQKKAKEKVRRDQIFRKIFGHPALLLMFLQDYVKEDWVEGLTLGDFERQPCEFLSIFGKDRESDVVFKIRLRDLEIYLILLVEHQGAVHHLMAFRIFEYMALIWRSWLENIPENEYKKTAFKIPMILPIVYFDGLGNWTAKTSFLDKVEHDPRLRKYIPKFEYKVVELKKISAEDLEKCSNALSLIFLLDKCNSVADVENAKKMRREYWERVKESLKDSGALEVVADCVQALLGRAGASPETTSQVVEALISGRLPEMFEHFAQDFRDEKAAWKKREMTLLKQVEDGRNLGARDEKISLLSKQFGKKFKTSPSAIEEIIASQSNETLDNLSENIFSIDSIEELKAFLRQQ